MTPNSWLDGSEKDTVPCFTVKEGQFLGTHCSLGPVHFPSLQTRVLGETALYAPLHFTLAVDPC